MQPTENVVLVPFPALEPLVGAYRRRLDRSAGWGVPIPHLTVGHIDLAAMRAAATDLAPKLPVRAAVDHVRVMEGTAAPDSWRTVAEISLRAPAPGPRRPGPPG